MADGHQKSSPKFYSNAIKRFMVIELTKKINFKNTIPLLFQHSEQERVKQILIILE